MYPSGMDGKIVSITTARKGVYAYWANDMPGVRMTQIELWALTDTGKLVGIVLSDEMSGEMTNAESSRDFIGYADDDCELSEEEIKSRTEILRGFQAESDED